MVKHGDIDKARQVPPGAGGGHRAQIILSIISGLTAVAVAFVSGRATGGERPEPGPTVTATVTPTTQPSPYAGAEWIEFTNPHKGSVDKVGRCIDVGGVGVVPPTQALVLVVQRENDPQRYFEAAVNLDAEAKSWSGRLLLGDESEPNGNFVISAILMDEKLAQYLATTNRYSGHEDNTWWASAQPPPTSRTVAAAQVERISNVKGC